MNTYRTAAELCSYYSFCKSLLGIKLSLYIFFVTFLLSAPLFSQVPKTISYQGILSDTSGNVKSDGIYSFTFRFYTEAGGGTPFWTEIQSLQVERGLFHAVLGSVTPFDDDVTFDGQYWMGVEVGTEGELMPRMPLTSVGYSFRSAYSDLAETVPDNSLTSDKFLDGEVVKKINGLSDNITFEGANGATVSASGNKITISASGGSGGGITAIQNTDNTLAITNPSGPTANVNMKVPLTVTGSSAEFIFKGDNSGTGTGIFGLGGLNGVLGYSADGYGIRGSSNTLNGVFGTSEQSHGVVGWASVANAYGVWGRNHNISGAGVYGNSDNGAGVWGTSINGAGGSFSTLGLCGVRGQSTSGTGIGVYGVNTSNTGWGVFGENNSASGDARGVVGISNQGWGVSGLTVAGYGIYGSASGTNGTGIYGRATASGGIGIIGNTSAGTYSILGQHTASGNTFGSLGYRSSDGQAVAGVYGYSSGGGGNASGIWGAGVSGSAAGTFVGSVGVFGNFYATNKNFKIDHPQYPETKYLIHASIESDNRMNIYNGNITTDASGNAVVQLPSYFESLNIEYRYQLTVIGQFAQAIVESEIQNNSFTIKTDKPNVKVSWQVSGIRNDVYARNNPMIVEVDKNEMERGKYLFPELYGKPEETGINYNKVEMPVLQKSEFNYEQMEKINADK